MDLNVVMTADGRFIEIQGTAENEPFADAVLNKMLNLAKAGIQEIITSQKDLIQNINV